MQTLVRLIEYDFPDHGGGRHGLRRIWIKNKWFSSQNHGFCGRFEKEGGEAV